jgi:hypothetical protein
MTDATPAYPEERRKLLSFDEAKAIADGAAQESWVMDERDRRQLHRDNLLRKLGLNPRAMPDSITLRSDVLLGVIEKIVDAESDRRFELRRREMVRAELSLRVDAALAKFFEYASQQFLQMEVRSGAIRSLVGPTAVNKLHADLAKDDVANRRSIREKVLETHNQPWEPAGAMPGTSQPEPEDGMLRMISDAQAEMFGGGR